MLFRFSALTCNAHRTHYDQRWVVQEGYGGLVVHGPLQAFTVLPTDGGAEVCDVFGTVTARCSVSPLG